MSEERKVGQNFDADDAESIFDRLKNVEGKIKPKKEEGKLRNISNVMSEANYLKGSGRFAEAIELYKQVIFELPDSYKAYEALADIYQKQGDVDSEKKILIKAIANCKNNEMFKRRLDELR